MARQTFICKTCNKIFNYKLGSKNIFCSYKCYWKSLKGKPMICVSKKGERRNPQTEFKKNQKPWNKGLKGICKSNQGSFKKKENKMKTEIGWYKRITINGNMLYEHRIES